MAQRTRVVIVLTNGLARYVSPQKSADLMLAGRVTRQGEHLLEAYPFALDQFFKTATIRYDQIPENKGWSVEDSAGMPCWQMVEGGFFQPV